MGKRGQFLVSFVLVLQGVLVTSLIADLDLAVLANTMNRADVYALLAAQAGSAAIATGDSYYAGNPTILLDPGRVATACSSITPYPPPPGLVSINCVVAPDHTFVDAYVTWQAPLPIPIPGLAPIVMIRRGVPAYGRSCGTYSYVSCG